jgi:hypothetical protein
MYPSFPLILSRHLCCCPRKKILSSRFLCFVPSWLPVLAVTESYTFFGIHNGRRRFSHCIRKGFMAGVQSKALIGIFVLYRFIYTDSVNKFHTETSARQLVILFCPQNVHTNTETHPASYWMLTGPLSQG